MVNFGRIDKGIFMINLVAIIYNPKTKKILIGRREKDEYVPELGWSFPGGRPAYDRDLEESLKDEIMKKTNVNVSVKSIIFARITPEIERKQIIIYYYCETKDKEAKAGEKFSEVKWIPPQEYKKYFTTSVNEKIARFLEELR